MGRSKRIRWRDRGTEEQRSRGTEEQRDRGPEGQWDIGTEGQKNRMEKEESKQYYLFILGMLWSCCKTG